MSLKDTNRASRQPKRIALVLANPAVSTTTGWPVGFWWAELSHPYYVFTEHGYEVELFSPDGGPCEPDAMSDPNDASGYSASDLISQGFIHTPALRARVDATRPVASKLSGPCLMMVDALPSPRRVSARTRASSSCSENGLAM